MNGQPLEIIGDVRLIDIIRIDPQVFGVSINVYLNFSWHDERITVKDSEVRLY